MCPEEEIKVMRIFLILAAFFLTGLTAQAQSDNVGNPTVPDRSYKLLREDENWTFLRDRALRQDFWDPIKYIPLRNRANDWYLASELRLEKSGSRSATTIGDSNPT